MAIIRTGTQALLTLVWDKAALVSFSGGTPVTRAHLGLSASSSCQSCGTTHVGLEIAQLRFPLSSLQQQASWFWYMEYLLR